MTRRPVDAMFGRRLDDVARRQWSEGVRSVERVRDLFEPLAIGDPSEDVPDHDGLCLVDDPLDLEASNTIRGHDGLPRVAEDSATRGTRSRWWGHGCARGPRRRSTRACSSWN